LKGETRSFAVCDGKWKWGRFLVLRARGAWSCEVRGLGVGSWRTERWKLEKARVEVGRRVQRSEWESELEESELDDVRISVLGFLLALVCMFHPEQQAMHERLLELLASDILAALEIRDCIVGVNP
jgi:hypothetical protein